MPPYQEGEDSLFFETFNRNKQSISLDLRHPDAQRGASTTSSARATPCTRTCAATSRAKLGLTYDQLRHVNPRIVCCSLSGFGMTGPRATEGGYDYMMQGLAGWQSLTGRAGRAADEERALARRPLRRLRLRDRIARRALARAPRRRRLRLRRLAVRDRAARADVHRPVGGDARLRAAAPAQLGAPVDRPVPELPGLGRLVRRRRREAEVLGAALRCRSAAPTCSRTSGSRPWRRRNEHRDALLPELDAAFAARTADEWLGALVAAGVPASRSQLRRGGARGPAGRGARCDRRARPPDPRSCAHDPDAAPARGGRYIARAPGGARAVPRRAHRGRPRRALRLHPRACARSWTRRASSASG